MKTLVGALFLSLSFGASAQVIHCGYGSLEKTVVCELSSSATYEAGYTEVYATQTIRLSGRYDGRAAIALGNLTGTATYNPVARGAAGFERRLTISFNQPVAGAAGSISRVVTFPECGENATTAPVQYSGSFVENFGSYSSPRDLFVTCHTEASFQQD